MDSIHNLYEEMENNRKAFSKLTWNISKQPRGH